MHDRVKALIFLTMLSTVISCLLSAGCKKSAPVTVAPPLENVVTNRANDPAYLSALKKNRTSQNVLARENHAVAGQLAACAERVKAALPPGADQAALKAALEKDPEWQALKGRETKVLAEDTQTLGAARELIRARMEREARDAKAVAEGKAQAVDQPKVAK
jgi:hypothetical protein